MVSLLIRSAGLCALACGLAAAPLSPARAAGSAGAELQRQILDVIMKHPEVILDTCSNCMCISTYIVCTLLNM